MSVYRAPLIVFVCALAAALGLAAYVQLDEQRRLQEHVDGIAVYTAHWMEDRIEADLDAVDRMVERWVYDGGNGWESWHSDALEYVQDIPEIRAIEWADTTFHIRRVVPSEGNEAAQGIDLTQVLEEGNLLVEAARTGETFTTRAIELVQGGAGFVAYHPLYLGNDFNGLMIAVFDVNRLMELLAESEFGRETVIAFGQDDIVFGVTSEGAIEEYSSSTIANLSGREWSVTIHAKQVLLDEFLTWGPALTLLIGMMLSLALSSAVYASLRARQRQRESELAQIALGEELASANQRFEAAAIGASVGIWDWIDVSKDELWCSPVLYKLLGYEPGELDTRQRFFADIVHPADREQLTKSITEHFTLGEPFRSEYRLRHKMGEYRWFIGSGAAIRSEDGDPIRMVGSIMDIDQLIQTQHNLERASRAKSDFLANMSHEIRTPMNGILGMVTMMMLSDMPEEFRNDIEVIKTSSDAMMGIVNDILDISKIEAGRVSIEHEPVDLNTVLHKCVSLYSAQANIKELPLTVEIPDQWVAEHILGDEVRLLQVLGNLVSNAIKFSSSGGIKIRVDQEVVANEKVRTRFEIIDTGVGIPENKIEEVFEPFTQADTSTTRQFGGTGLGLSIAQELATMMDGELGAVSSLGEGSTFWFTVVNEPARSNHFEGEAFQQSSSGS